METGIETSRIDKVTLVAGLRGQFDVDPIAAGDRRARELAKVWSELETRGLGSVVKLASLDAAR